MSSAAPRQRAHRALFISLVNDAALFPPAALPVDEAVRAHHGHREAEYADLVGPFLVGVGAVDELVATVVAGTPPPPAIGLVARPGTSPADITTALSSLRTLDGARVVSLDTAWAPDWRDLDLDGLVVNLEVGRAGQDLALDDIAAAAHVADVRAKFRTGPTPDWTWPDAAELATFVLGAAQRHLPFVLTGGLHHVVRGEHGVGGQVEEQHGLLNVLVAVHASAGGADEQTVRELLHLRDADALADIVARWSSPDVAAVRAAFAGYGCCDVTDPIGGLGDLGLLAPSGA
ncbi:hypothetical protein [Janibacter sp. GS2]|uniref:hypothetical protein n=1 Tax=Janibacter sp. GS2 TaxID=3442646 RepID=UPI003EBAF44B